ncbi:O-antigen ligase family protein [Sphingosinicella sp. LHD-64]|uniref:O-antigen ligase family protein n=1 Tax=Sphingosinicella sp. LHD-64 TaxID=3072139 RepID=UPI00280F9964|nr:O-antigen ligase family protein [Sphingosinicella sp. LHD-64]MDQ8757237.1 O-antigen ligase family protein [Sphingosinicella sp. LHD-64]
MIEIMNPSSSTMIRSDDDIAARVRYAVFVLFLILCFAGGGGSREDILSLLYLRPGAILCLAVILALPGRVDWKLIRVPLWLLVGLTALMTIQLVPLPPSLWTTLPGRAIVAEGAQVLEMAQPWRPISLAPDLTQNSLAAMVIPLTALIGFAALGATQRENLAIIFIGGGVVSGLLGIMQLSGGSDSLLYTYRITNNQSAVGLFANRNHQAVMLALSLPMLAIAAAHATGDRHVRAVKRGSAAAVSIVLLLVLLVAGSRAGLVLGGAASVWSIFHYIELRRFLRGERVARQRSLVLALTATAAVGAGLVFLSFARAQSLQRLIGVDMQGEERLRQLPYVAQMARDYFPVGAGFGAFDPAYRIREPLDLLSTRYLNHAHNDFLEFVITGGLPATLLLLAFLLWWGTTSWSAFRGGRAYGMLGSILVAFLLLASLVDYPLRVPVLAALFAVACGWLCSASKSRS